MEKQKTAVYLNVCTLLGLFGMAWFIWYGIQNRLFVSAEALELVFEIGNHLIYFAL